MLEINPELTLDESELTEDFVRASGPGGQHVNKVASAVQLRFKVMQSPNLSDAVKHRIMKLAASQISGDGELIINAQKYRSQDRNRKDARDRLVNLIRRALETPKQRKATKPSRQAREKRLKAKKKRAEKKKTRQSPPPDTD